MVCSESTIPVDVSHPWIGTRRPGIALQELGAVLVAGVVQAHDSSFVSLTGRHCMRGVSPASSWDSLCPSDIEALKLLYAYSSILEASDWSGVVEKFSTLISRIAPLKVYACHAELDEVSRH